MITTSAHTSYRRLYNAQTCLGNTRASLHAVVAKPFYLYGRRPVESHGTRVSTRAHHTRWVHSEAEWCASVPNPSLAARCGPMLRDAWQHQTPPGWRRGSWASGHVATTEPSLSREVGSGTAMARGSVWTHTLSFVLTWSMYTGYPAGP
jgi:hypothetical protein